MENWQIEDAKRLSALFAKKANMPQHEFGSRFGIGTQGMVSQYLHGRRPLNIEAATAFAEGLGVALEEISPHLAATLRRAYDRVQKKSLPAVLKKSEEIEIPQYNGTGGSMGGGVLLRDQPGEIQNWRVTPEWLSKNVRQHSGAANLRIVTGFGDSMRPLFNPGDPLLVDAGVSTVEFDSIYFFRIGDEGFIKRLQRIPGQGLVAISENKAYKEWVVRPDMDFEVFGRVLKVWCGTEF